MEMNGWNLNQEKIRGINMESWEDLIKTLPTDETLEQKEKSGELKDIDRKIEDIQAKIENMKTEMDERRKYIIETGNRFCRVKALYTTITETENAYS